MLLSWTQRNTKPQPNYTNPTWFTASFSNCGWQNWRLGICQCLNWRWSTQVMALGSSKTRTPRFWSKCSETDFLPRQSLVWAPAISIVIFHHAKVDMKRKQHQASKHVQACPSTLFNRVQQQTDTSKHTLYIFMMYTFTRAPRSLESPFHIGNTLPNPQPGMCFEIGGQWNNGTRDFFSLSKLWGQLWVRIAWLWRHLWGDLSTTIHRLQVVSWRTAGLQDIQKKMHT